MMWLSYCRSFSMQISCGHDGTAEELLCTVSIGPTKFALKAAAPATGRSSLQRTVWCIVCANKQNSKSCRGDCGTRLHLLFLSTSCCHGLHAALALIIKKLPSRQRKCAWHSTHVSQRKYLLVLCKLAVRTICRRFGFRHCQSRRGHSKASHSGYWHGNPSLGMWRGRDVRC